MSRIKKVVLSIAIMLPLFAGAAFAEDAKPTASISVAFLNQYVFRGYQFSKKSLIVQPTETITYNGVSASLFENYDSNEHATDNFVPTKPGRRNMNEGDVTVSYTKTIDKLSLTGGYAYYGTEFAAETSELFVSAALDTIAKPTLSVYRDVGQFHAYYINLALAHSVAIAGATTLDLGASAGYEYGDSEPFRTRSGDLYRHFHDGSVKASMTIPFAKLYTAQPLVQYNFPLSSRAKEDVKLHSSTVYGVTMGMNF